MALVALVGVAGCAVVAIRVTVARGSCGVGDIGARVDSYHWQAAPTPPLSAAMPLSADVVARPTPGFRSWASSGVSRLRVGNRMYAPQQGAQWTVAAWDGWAPPLADFWSGFKVSSSDHPAGGDCHLTGRQGDTPVELWVGGDGLPSRAAVTYPACHHKGCPPQPETVTYTYSQVNRLAPVSPPPAAAVWRGGSQAGTVGRRSQTADGGAVTVRSATFADGSPDPSLPALPAAGRYLVADVVLENSSGRQMPYWLQGPSESLAQEGGFAAIDGGCQCSLGTLEPRSTTQGRLVFKVDVEGAVLVANLGFTQVSVPLLS